MGELFSSALARRRRAAYPLLDERAALHNTPLELLLASAPVEEVERGDVDDTSLGWCRDGSVEGAVGRLVLAAEGDARLVSFEDAEADVGASSVRMEEDHAFLERLELLVDVRDVHHVREAGTQSDTSTTAGGVSGGRRRRGIVGMIGTLGAFYRTQAPFRAASQITPQ